MAEFVQIPHYKSFKTIIVDLRNVTHNENHTIVPKLVNERKNEPILDFTFAYIVDNPKMTVIMELYTAKFQKQNYKYFSTLTGACKHFKINRIDQKKIEEYLSKN